MLRSNGISYDALDCDVTCDFLHWPWALTNSLFAKIISPTLFGNSWGNSYVQFLVVISCFTLLLLSFQQEAEWVNINFERTALNIHIKVNPPKPPVTPMILEKFSFSFICLTQNFKLCLKLLLPGTVSFSTSYQRWLIRQWLLISNPWFCLVSSLISTPIKQPYSKVGNCRMYRCIGIKMLFSLQIFTKN